MRKRFFLVILLVLALTMQNTWTSRTYTSAEELPVVENVDKTIKILQLQPYNKNYPLNSQFFSQLYEGNVEIENMSISLFNALRDDLNGKYDMIFVGAPASNSYRPLVSTVRGNVKKSNNSNDFLKSDYLPSIDWTGARRSNFADASSDDTENRGEILPGRDITYLRAKDLKSFIESGQVVVFQSSCFIRDDTKLYDVFSEENLPDMDQVFYVDSFTEDNLQPMFNYYKKGYFDVKPTLEVTKKPKVYNKNGVPQYITDSNGRLLNFEYTLEHQKANKDYMGKLYLDTNGDGLFKEEELFREKAYTHGVANSIGYTIPAEYVGLLQWKLVVEELRDDGEEGVKVWDTDYCAFKGNTVNDEIKIKVLQITPTRNLHRNNDLNLETDQYTNTLTHVTNLYDIDVTAMTAEQFNANVPELNGVYDMIIIGFCDEVSRGVQISSEEALNAIQDFIDSGQSMMITHDMFHFYVGERLSNNLEAKAESMVNAYDSNYLSSSTFRQQVRKMEKTYNDLEDKLQQLGVREEYKEYMDNIESSMALIVNQNYYNTQRINALRTIATESKALTVAYQENMEVMMERFMAFTQRFRDQMGQNIYSSDYLREVDGVETESTSQYYKEDYPTLNGETYKSMGVTRTLAERYNGVGSWKTTTTGKKINDGAVTMFPHILADQLPVATTHSQYYMADLENRDLLVWYTLKSNYYDEQDARNNYYIYSLNNITYSGTGHSRPGGADEKKLFVNTMLKAAASANHGPKIEVSGIGTGKRLSSKDNTMSFKMYLSDGDLPDKISKYSIYVDINDNGQFTENERVYPVEGSYAEAENRQWFDVVVNKSKFNDQLQLFDMKITAEDQHGAKGELVIEDIKNEENPLMTVSAGFSRGVLIGDEADLSINLAQISIPGMTEEEVNNMFSNFRLTVSTDEVSEQAFSLSNSNQWQRVTGVDKLTYRYTGSITSSGKTVHFKPVFNREYPTGVQFDVDLSYKEGPYTYEDSSYNNEILVKKPTLRVTGTDGGDKSITMEGKTYSSAGGIINDFTGTGTYNYSYSYSPVLISGVTIQQTYANGGSKVVSDAVLDSGEVNARTLTDTVEMSFAHSPIIMNISLQTNEDLGIKLEDPDAPTDHLGGVHDVLVTESGSTYHVATTQTKRLEFSMNVEHEFTTIDFDIEVEGLNSNAYTLPTGSQLPGLTITQNGSTYSFEVDSNLVTQAYNGNQTIAFTIPVTYNAGEEINSSSGFKLVKTGITYKGEYTNLSGAQRVDVIPIPLGTVQFSNQNFGVFEKSGKGKVVLDIEPSTVRDIENLEVKFTLYEKDANEENIPINWIPSTASIKLDKVALIGGVVTNITNNEVKVVLDTIPAGTAILPARLYVTVSDAKTNKHYKLVITEIAGVTIDTTMNPNTFNFEKNMVILHALDLE